MFVQNTDTEASCAHSSFIIISEAAVTSLPTRCSLGSFLKTEHSSPETISAPPGSILLTGGQQRQGVRKRPKVLSQHGVSPCTRSDRSPTATAPSENHPLSMRPNMKPVLVHVQQVQWWKMHGVIHPVLLHLALIKTLTDKVQTPTTSKNSPKINT